ncbi:cell division protein FtsA [Bartonella quintana]|uniref:Cell division protein FtsA n=3 Tax=Bartonella quintana TaxID=803 RepID=W3TWC3_BARQI|nr:cell division protein FtsA [Bartonella quintana]AFR26553.1 cell division protein ftsA [Bartonella quintana RM-11]ETS13280.1 cell division protein FtsA [Bartonella quintana BQ2-D70]ETS14063.1 cell division protein FtsA [Bartonella quintana JK 73rel]ETS15750.1 cell division protein FtsA [Bartonella quintana JK 73]ETS17753.1 cell division protein FtsA [Bartonella quintana JK 7]
MMLFRSHHGGGRKTRFLTVLDVGSSKIVCLIACLRPLKHIHYLHGRTHSMEILGFGVQRSRGIKSGVVMDMFAAEQSIRLAVDAAEKMAGLVVDSVIVNFSSSRLRSAFINGMVRLNGREVTKRDVRMALADVSHKAFDAERHVLHSVPVSYVLDGDKGISDPIGMTGELFGVDVHVVTAETASLRNLEACINRAHLSVEAMVVTPFASGLAVLMNDEAHLGAACIDFGGGTTTFSVFSEGKFVHADALAVGGYHVTLDVARGFSMSITEAERLKVVYGSALLTSADERHMINVTEIGNKPGEIQYPRAVLGRIIRARVEEILEMVRDCLNRSGFGHIIGKRVILTGGASQLTGLPEMARTILGRNVRIGRPLGISRLPSLAKGAAFTSAVGLLIYPQLMGFEEKTVQAAVNHLSTGTRGYFQCVGQWLRESF